MENWHLHISYLNISGFFHFSEFRKGTFRPSFSLRYAAVGCKYYVCPFLGVIIACWVTSAESDPRNICIRPQYWLDSDDEKSRKNIKINTSNRWKLIILFLEKFTYFWSGSVKMRIIFYRCFLYFELETEGKKNFSDIFANRVFYP